MDLHPDATISERISARLEKSAPSVHRHAVDLYAQAGLPNIFPARFMEIYSSLARSWVPQDFYQSGWHAGAESTRFLASAEIPIYAIIRDLEGLRIQLLFGFVPTLLEPPDRTPYFEGLAKFLTGYIRGMSAATSIDEYREIGEIARRLTAAESPAQLEREAVQGAYRILDVDYAWYTHRENGLWNISHATSSLSHAAREARMRDEDVDGIERLLSGSALVYEDIEKCAPSMQALGKLLHLGSALSVPVMNRDVCVGTLGVGRRVASYFNERDVAVVRLIASQTSAARNEKEAALNMGSTLTALQDSEAKLRALAEAIPQIVWTANPDGYIDWYNRQWYEYTGQTHAQAKGWGWQAVHDPASLPVVMERWPHSIRTGERFEMEMRLRGRDGEFRWFLTRVHPVVGEDGEIIKWYGTNTDIHEQKIAMRRKDEIANTLQQIFIPKAFPVTDFVSFDAVYMPAENDAQVGGDWYDAFALPDGTLAFSIGDVAGHGLEAAVTMGKIRQVIFSSALDSSDPSEVLNKVNRVLLLQDEIVVTAIVGFIDASGKRITYASAGHAPPIVASRDGLSLMRGGGLALGIQESLQLRNHTIDAIPGMLIVLYTDGITEAERNIFDGEKRLMEAVFKVSAVQEDMPALRIVDLALARRTQRDDIALLAIRFLEDHVAGGVSSIQSRPYGMAWDFDSSDADAAQRARRQVVEFIRRTASGDPDLFAVESILGELIANTVDHAPGPVHIDIDWTAQAPRLSVRDRGIAFVYDPRAVRAPATMSEAGRGLFIIAALGTDISVQRHAGEGKTVSVTLPVRRSIV